MSQGLANSLYALGLLRYNPGLPWLLAFHQRLTHSPLAFPTMALDRLHSGFRLLGFVPPAPPAGSETAGGTGAKNRNEASTWTDVQGQGANRPWYYEGGDFKAVESSPWPRPAADVGEVLERRPARFL